MAHNLAIINGKAAMAYMDRTPWHGLGQRLTGGAGVDAALAAAQLDYVVQLQDLTLPDGQTLAHHKGVVRLQADGLPPVQLGCVGDGYNVVQNSEACAILRPLTEDFGCTIEAAGALGDGQRGWMLAKLKDATITPVPGDDIRGYFLLHWSHDGQTGINGLGTGIRVVCQNTLDLATGGRGRKAWISIRHTASAAARLDEAAGIVRQLAAAMQTTGDTFAQLAGRAMGPAELASYIETVFPSEGPKVAPVLQARRDTVARLVFMGRGSDLANQNVPAGQASAWAAYNAVTEYFDHVRPAEAQSASGLQRAHVSAIFGGNADIKTAALVAARQLVAA